LRTADPVKIERILDAAGQLFAERHYHEVRMDDVAARAGVAKGTIYLHFKDKDDLYQALTLASLRKLSERVREALEGLSDPATKFLRCNREFIAYFASHPFALDLINRLERLQAEDQGAKGAFFELRNDFKRLLHSILREFPEAKHQSDADVSLAVLAFLGSTKEVLRELPRPWPGDLPERLTRLFLKGFLGAGPSGAAPRSRMRASRRA
jgi:AcrR family transcriptional regulator